MQPRFAAGEDESRLLSETKALLDNGRWSLADEHMAVEKTFYFPNYTKCMDFANSVAIRSKSQKHHSTMIIEYGSVRLRWTTHQPRGLSSKDTSMARYCDEQAATIGTVDRSKGAKCGPTPSS